MTTTSCRRALRGAWLFLSATAVTFFCTSCASSLNSTYANDVLNHALVVKSDGAWADPRDKLVEGFHATDGMTLEKQLQRISDRLDAQNATAANPLKLLVFVHGGLHSWAASCETYRRLREPMEQAGYYPIFIIWDSDLFTSYGDRLWRVRQGEDSPYLAPLTSIFVLPIDLGTALMRTPLVWSAELRTDLRTTEMPRSPQRNDHDAIEKFLQRRLPNSVLRGEDYRSLRERSYYFASYCLFLAPRLAFSPIIDGLGSKAWDIMLRRTQTMFHPPKRVDIFARLAAQRDFLGVQDPQGLPGGAEWREQIIGDWYEKTGVSGVDDAPVGAMWVFSRRLRQWSLTKPVEVHLFGHSMGTIVLNELMRQVPDVKVSRIGYLAAACTITDWQTSVLPYLRSPVGQDTKFYAVTLHRMREQSERNPGSVLDLAPRGSLLDWIDNFFANPTTIAGRTMGSWDNTVRVVPQFAVDGDGQSSTGNEEATRQVMNRIHLHCLDAADISFHKPEDSQPQKHGDFAEWPFWMDSFLWPERQSDMPRRLKTPDTDTAMPATIF